MYLYIFEAGEEKIHQQTQIGSICIHFNLKKLNILWNINLYKSFVCGILSFHDTNTETSYLQTLEWKKTKHLQQCHSSARTHMYMLYIIFRALPEYSSQGEVGMSNIKKREQLLQNQTCGFQSRSAHIRKNT